MADKTYRGVEEARNQLPSLLEQASLGTATVITRHGRPIAALIPIESYGALGRQQSLLPLAASGKGLWGRHSRATVRKLRDEWSR